MNLPRLLALLASLVMIRATAQDDSDPLQTGPGPLTESVQWYFPAPQDLPEQSELPDPFQRNDGTRTKNGLKPPSISA